MAKKEVTKDDKSCPNPNCDGNANDDQIDYGTYELVDGSLWKQPCECKKCGLGFDLYYDMSYDVTVYEENDIKEVSDVK